MTLLRFVLFIVLTAGLGLIFNLYSNFTLKTNHTVELIWAVIPFILLCVLSVFSIQTLYITRRTHTKEASQTLIAQAEQWRWDFTTTEKGLKKVVIPLGSFWQTNLPPSDSYTPSNNSVLYTSSTNYVEPFAYSCRSSFIINKKNLRIRVTSADVLHSFFVPSLSLKIDAIPGRVQETLVTLTREGKFYGMCAEYCGFYHSIMPFSLKTIK